MTFYVATRFSSRCIFNFRTLQAPLSTYIEKEGILFVFSFLNVFFLCLFFELLKKEFFLFTSVL
jgi:hypothetical protein